ncbi:protein containing methyltransferase domain [sediment metagenome]|uniref:Protein containing methyltransferase domain n=1 Tax=sediment metagenome TaxID=749907 RepID=D9PGC1_9ZZZZ
MPDKTDSDAVLRANLAFYNKHASGYDTDPAIHHLLSHAGQSLIQECVDFCRKESKGAVWVDAGCGTGQVMSIAKNFPITIGFDISHSMLAIAHAKGHRVLLADASNIPVVSGSVDVITACAVLHHLPDPMQFLTEAFRALKPGGMLFTDFDPNNRPSHGSLLFTYIRNIYRTLTPKRKSIHTINRDTEKQSHLADYQMYYNNFFNGESVSEMARKAGFEVVRIDYYFNKEGLDKRDLVPFNYLIRRVLMAPVTKMFDSREIAPHFLLLAKKPPA